MAIQTLATLKGWAIRGWKPLAQQIKDWMDSFWHKNDQLPISSVAGLQEALALLSAGSGGGGIVTDIQSFDTDGTWILPAGKLFLYLVATSETAQVISMGTTPGGKQIFEDEAIAPGVPTPLGTGKFFPVNTTLYLSGITAQINIIFYKL